MGKQRYAILREVFPALSAQAAIHVVRKVADAYQKDKKTLRKFESLRNHVISKQIVAKAKRTVRGIAVEELTGIRERIRARRRQRAVLHSWSFFQLRQFLEYKAALAGVPRVAIDPRHTSCECSACGYIDKANRKAQKEFCCLRCRYTALADHNAARVIASRAYVSTPIAAMPEMALAASPRLGPWGC